MFICFLILQLVLANNLQQFFTFATMSIQLGDLLSNDDLLTLRIQGKHLYLFWRFVLRSSNANYKLLEFLFIFGYAHESFVFNSRQYLVYRAVRWRTNLNYAVFISMQEKSDDARDSFGLASSRRTLNQLDAVRFKTLNLVENIDLTVVVIRSVWSHHDWQAGVRGVFNNLGFYIAWLQQRLRNSK